jgi:hypothetical protein
MSVSLALQQIRQALYEYDKPIYFLDWSVSIMLGMQPYLPQMRFICATDVFAGLQPHVFVPPSYQYNHDLTCQEIVNELLQNEDVIDFINQNGKGKLCLWEYDELSEKLASELGLEICASPLALRLHWDNKANTNRLAEKAGVPCVPYVLSPVENYAHLRKISKHLGERLVVQMPHGQGGKTTFFINKEADFEQHKAQITNGEEMKIMRYIRCFATSQEVCIIRNGTVVSPLATELVGIPELSLYHGGWVGAEILPYRFPTYIIEQAKTYSVKLGEQLREVGYLGHFEASYLIDEADGTLYLGEINMRFSGNAPVVNNANYAHRDIPLLLLHLATWLDIPCDIDVEALNTRWTEQDTLEPMSMLNFSNVYDKSVKPLRTGIYKSEANGEVVFVRPALAPNEIKNTEEFFWYNAADMEATINKDFEFGAIFAKSNVTIQGNTLTPQAKAWVDGLTRLYLPN